MLTNIKFSFLQNDLCLFCFWLACIQVTSLVAKVRNLSCWGCCRSCFVSDAIVFQSKDAIHYNSIWCRNKATGADPISTFLHEIVTQASLHLFHFFFLWAFRNSGRQSLLIIAHVGIAIVHAYPYVRGSDFFCSGSEIFQNLFASRRLLGLGSCIPGLLSVNVRYIIPVLLFQLWFGDSVIARFGNQVSLVWGVGCVGCLWNIGLAFIVNGIQLVVRDVFCKC